ncbi:MAG: hypothetical protein WAJ94_02160 [Candidatus Cybelea sp.]
METPRRGRRWSINVYRPNVHDPLRALQTFAGLHEADVVVGDDYPELNRKTISETVSPEARFAREHLDWPVYDSKAGESVRLKKE